MPRNYFCDFCQCSFPDNKTNRKNHNEGATHITNRKLHYDWYKDPAEFIQEQLNKPPCKYYQQHNHCEFGLLCKFNHITFDTTGQMILPPEIVQWFQSQQQEAMNETPIVVKQKRKRYKLPSGWKVKDLPLSLKPPPSKNGYDWNHVGSWG